MELPNSPLSLGAVRPYDEVYGQYESAARQSLSRNPLPPSLQGLVQRYFSCSRRRVADSRGLSVVLSDRRPRTEFLARAVRDFSPASGDAGREEESVTQSDARKNREYWDGRSDEYQGTHGPQLNTRPCSWGVWSIPEDDLGVLEDVRGKDILELGCGAAQWSICLTKRGARTVGLDNSSRQLQHARRLMDGAGVRFPLVQASAETVPVRDRSFDIVFCDHGAMSYADPRYAVAEAARVLGPGGLFAFTVATPLVNCCWNEEADRVGASLVNDYFNNRRGEYQGMVEFNVPYGEWVRLFVQNGLVIEDLIELRPPEEAETTYNEFVPLEWADGGRPRTSGRSGSPGLDGSPAAKWEEIDGDQPRIEYAAITVATGAPAALEAQAKRARESLVAATGALGQVIVGQAAVVEQVLTALVAGGHVLLEGVPGLGQDAAGTDSRPGDGARASGASSSPPT